jgi:hypothetical protein
MFAGKKHWTVSSRGISPMCGSGTIGWEYDAEHIGQKSACARCVMMMTARGIDSPPE